MTFIFEYYSDDLIINQNDKHRYKGKHTLITILKLFLNDCMALTLTEIQISKDQS